MKTAAFIDRQSIDRLIGSAKSDRVKFLREFYQTETLGKAARRSGLMALVMFCLTFIAARHVTVDHSEATKSSHATFSRYY